MALALYELVGLDNRRYSLFSWRARLALAHKTLAVEYRPVRVSDKPAIAFSGQEKVPILVEDGAVIFDSWRIAEYLEDRFPDAPSLFGGPVGRGLSRFVNAWTDRQVVPLAAPLVVPDVVECVDPADAAHLRAGMEKAFGKTLEAMRAERGDKVKAFRRALDPARATLKTQPFLAGSEPSYADYVLFSPFQWARVMSRFALLDADDKPMLAWRKRLLDLHGGLARAEPARQDSDPGERR